MKKTKINILFKISLITFLLLPGCDFSSSRLEFNRAERAYKDRDFKTARKYYMRVLKRNPDTELALRAAEVVTGLLVEDLNQYYEAVKIYQFLIVKTKDANKVYSYQQQIAEILFEKIQDFEKSIVEYNKLFALEKNKDQKTEYKIRIAKSYFNLNKFYQAQIEVDGILNRKLTGLQKFEMLLFKGNILLTVKDHKQAIAVYKQLIEEYPEKSLKENVHVNLAVCFEELSNFAQAISILEELKRSTPNADFIDSKVARLKQRQRNLPGARGRVR